MKKKNTFFIFFIFFLCSFSKLVAQKVMVIDNKGTLKPLNRVTLSPTAHGDPVEGDVWFDTSATNFGPIIDPSTGRRKYARQYELKIFDNGSWRKLSENIYNTDGKLSYSRIINGNGSSLTFENVRNFTLQANDQFDIESNHFINITSGSEDIKIKAGALDDVIIESSLWGKLTYKDSSGDVGSIGQILSSTGVGTNWIDAPITATGTEGSVFFANTDGTVTEDNDHFFWDKTNERLYIGAKLAGTNKLNVAGTTRTQGVSNSNGTANRPSYRFTDDSNTGMFRGSTSDHLRFATRGQEALTIDNSQKIGIGTTSPNSNFQVQGSVSKSILQITSGSGSFNLNEEHHTIILKTNRNLILPNANTCEGRIYVIKNVSGGSVNCSVYKDERDSNLTSIADKSVLWVQSNGTAWELVSKFSGPRIVASAKVEMTYAGATNNYVSHAIPKQFNISSISRLNRGDYQVTFASAMPDDDYVIQLSIKDCASNCPGAPNTNYDDPGITYYNQTANGFRINIGDSDNGGTPKNDIDLEFMFSVISW